MISYAVYLEGDDKTPLDRNEIVRDSRINFICHVYINSRQKLEEVYNNTIQEGNNENSTMLDLDQEIQSKSIPIRPTVRITQITDCESCNFVPDGCIWVGTEDGK